MDQLGAPLKLRQERLGHSDPRVTLGLCSRGGYTHATTGDDRELATQLGGILCPLVSKLEASAVAGAAQSAPMQ